MTRPDPRIIDEEITGEIEPVPTSWAAIILAALAAAALIYMTWSGVLFG